MLHAAKLLLQGRVLERNPLVAAPEHSEHLDPPRGRAADDEAGKAIGGQHVQLHLGHPLGQNLDSASQNIRSVKFRSQKLLVGICNRQAKTRRLSMTVSDQRWQSNVLWRVCWLSGTK